MKHSTMIAPLAALALTVTLGACKQADAPAAATAAAAADPAKVEGEVKAIVAELLAAFAARDSARAVAVDAADYVGMSPGMPNDVGPAADKAATEKFFADPALKLAADDQKVTVSNDGTMAVDASTYTLEFTDPQTKKPMVEKGNWVSVYRRQADGTMKMALSFHAPTGAAVAK